MQSQSSARRCAHDGGVPLELKLEARNITGRDHFEFQDNGTRRIDINSYEVGRSFGASISGEF